MGRGIEFLNRVAGGTNRVRRVRAPTVALVAAALALTAGPTPARAQRGAFSRPPAQAFFPGPRNAGAPPLGVQPFFQVAPGLSLAQSAYNTTTMGMAYQRMPAAALPFAPGYSMGYSPFTPAGQMPVNVSPSAALAAGGYVGGGLSANPYGGAGASMTSTAGGGYGGYGGYPYQYPDPFSGYLQGAGSVIRSQSEFLVSYQQSRLLREQVQRERIDNRRRALDEWLYERETRPTAEDERQRTQVLLLRRARNSPPAGEVYNGQALNTLLAALEKRPAGNVSAVAVPLDPDTLRHVNLAPAGVAGNAGLLQNGGKVNWPLALEGGDFQADRERLDALLPDAVRQAKANDRVDAATLRDVTAAADRVGRALRESIKDIPPAQHMEARRFLGSLEDALRVLRSPNAGKYLNGTFAAQGKTVPDLIEYMKNNGLRFAPAVTGGESAYLALHQALADYDAAVATQAAAQTGQ